MKQLTLPLDDPSMALTVFIPSLKAAMNRAAAEHPRFSREELLDRMNNLAEKAGIKITGGNSKGVSMATFEKWLNPTDCTHIPNLLAVNVFCLASGDHRPMDVQLNLHGWGVKTKRERHLLQWAEAYFLEKEARKNKKVLEATL